MQFFFMNIHYIVVVIVYIIPKEFEDGNVTDKLV